MPRHKTTFYTADTTPNNSTEFWWADSGTDPFSRQLDLMYLALAVERHDHGDGRGKPVSKLTAASVNEFALASNSVTTTKIANNAVTGDKIAGNSITSAHIIDGAIAGVDLHPDAIKDRLGYVPVNKAGDTNVGSLAFLTGKRLDFIGPSVSAIAGPAVLQLSLTEGNLADFRTSNGACLLLHDRSAGGVSLGVYNQGGAAWDLYFTHSAATFGPGILIDAGSFVSRVPTGTPPYYATSTTVCPNLNAQYLEGQGSAFYGRRTFEVPTRAHLFFESAGWIPTGWARATNADGRLIVGAGSAAGISPANPFGEAAHAGGSWSVPGGGAHTHVISAHTHFLSNAPDRSIPASGTGPNTYALGNGTGPHPGTGDTATASSGAGAGAWNFPTYSLVMAYKQ